MVVVVMVVVVIVTKIVANNASPRVQLVAKGKMRLSEGAHEATLT
jgi:hypothetical protein